MAHHPYILLMEYNPIPVLFLFLVASAPAQDYVWPTEASQFLSSNFGEFRPRGYHMGIDIKTHEKEGYPVLAVADGYLYRMVANFTGYGRALYLMTDDGHTAVYAHLSAFSETFERLLTREQENNNSYHVNRYFQAGEWPVSAGSVIGYSGNSGYSYGPHLHFELRNQAEQPLNPLTHGFPLDDRIAPFLEEVALIPLSPRSWLNGSRLPQTFPLFRDRSGRYHFPDTLNCSGPLGLALNTLDRRQGVPNRYQVHRLELWLDGELDYALRFDSLDYGQIASANVIRDYRLARLNLGQFTKLYRLDSFPAVTVHAEEGNGILEPSPGYHQIQIKVWDAAGNQSVAEGTLLYLPPFELRLVEVQEKGAEITLELTPAGIAVPLQEISVYSFTPVGFADRKVNLIKQESNGPALRITLPWAQTQHRILQFIAVNRLGTYSRPFHWSRERFREEILDMEVDLEIAPTEAGLFLQVETNPYSPVTPTLLLRGREQYRFLPVERIQPNSFLSGPHPAALFGDVEQVEVVLAREGGGQEKRVRFRLQPRIAIPGREVTALSGDQLCSIRAGSNSVYDSTVIWIEAVEKGVPVGEGKQVSKVYQLQPYEVPLKDSIQVGIRYAEELKYESQLDLYYYDDKEGWTFIPTRTQADRRVLTGSINRLEAVAILQDQVPPRAVSSYPGPGGRYPSGDLQVVRIQVTDGLSGIDPAEKTLFMGLDGQPVRCAYQPVKKELYYRLPEPLEVGEHRLDFTVSDQAGNQRSGQINFRVD